MISSINSSGNLYAFRVNVSKSKPDRETGRLKPVICDLCKTYQSGANVAIVTANALDAEQKPTTRNVGRYCCADMNCSLHVRDLTPESHRSRAQLREHITEEGRIARLQENVLGFVEQLSIKPFNIRTFDVIG